MLLSAIEENPSKSLYYMERIVNNGSRSGFTEKNVTSAMTNPFTSDLFFIAKLSSTVDEMTSFGNLPNFCTKGSFLYIHPDSLAMLPNATVVTDTEHVIPTSSFRTVKFSDYPYYLKLHYFGVLGRITRELDERHILSSMEVTSIYDSFIRSGKAPDKFAFMREPGGRMIERYGAKFGYIIRESTPTGHNSDKIKYMIPGFSLFSEDRENKRDLHLILQLAERKKDKIAFLLDDLCFPLIDIYFTSMIYEGINPEMHSQNLLFGFDENWDVVSIVLRDMESADKDITIRQRNGKDFEYKHIGFKFIKESDDNYLIKHSFMFDHKLGEYLLNELTTDVCKYFQFNYENVNLRIKQYVHDKYGQYIENFFPTDGRWYKFENITIDRTKKSRPYQALENPLYR